MEEMLGPGVGKGRASPAVSPNLRVFAHRELSGAHLAGFYRGFTTPAALVNVTESPAVVQISEDVQTFYVFHQFSFSESPNPLTCFSHMFIFCCLHQLLDFQFTSSFS